MNLFLSANAIFSTTNEDESASNQQLRSKYQTIPKQYNHHPTESAGRFSLYEIYIYKQSCITVRITGKNARWRKSIESMSGTPTWWVRARRDGVKMMNAKVRSVCTYVCVNRVTKKCITLPGVNKPRGRALDHVSPLLLPRPHYHPVLSSTNTDHRPHLSFLLSSPLHQPRPQTPLDRTPANYFLSQENSSRRATTLSAPPLHQDLPFPTFLYTFLMPLQPSLLATSRKNDLTPIIELSTGKKTIFVIVQ